MGGRSIIPGVMMAFIYTGYILVRCYLQLSMAPLYDISHYSLLEKVLDTTRYIIPLGFIIFLVNGLIFIGIATPSEAAATGCVGSFLLAASYRQLNWKAVKKALSATVRNVSMLMLIMASVLTFSHIFTFSGATQGLIQFVLGLPLSPIVVIIGTQLISLAMGTFITVGGIIMITIPMFVPIITALIFDPI